MTKKYDIFISYRRAGGQEAALFLRQALVERGYRVFFDMESMRSGPFDTRLYSVIDRCKDFIIVLSPNCFELEGEEGGEWFRREIAHAIKHSKNIVPISLRDFEMPEAEELPENISGIVKYHSIRAAPDFFDAFLKKLVREFLRSRPVMARSRRLSQLKAALLGMIITLILLVCMLSATALYLGTSSRGASFFSLSSTPATDGTAPAPPRENTDQNSLAGKEPPLSRNANPNTSVERPQEQIQQADKAKRVNHLQEVPETGTTRTVTLADGVEFVMIWCAPGTYVMGSPACENREDWGECEPQHKVTLSKGFWLGKNEVTQPEWQTVTGMRPSNFNGKDLPVEQVSWDDSQGFITELNSKTGGQFRLPTEAEWEYACRAGTPTAFHFGDKITTEDANYNGGEYGYADGQTTYRSEWGFTNSWKDRTRRKTTPIGTFTANAWGFHDMHGNVGEWCADWYECKYYAKCPSIDPTGPASGEMRVFRGGGWASEPLVCRSGHRAGCEPVTRSSSLGLRLAASKMPGGTPK